LIWAGCFVLFFFLYMYLLSPQKRIREQIQRQRAEKKQLYDSAMSAAQEKTRVQLQQETDYLRNKLNDFVVDSADLVNVTLDIGRIASEGQLSSFSIRGKEKRKDSEIPNCERIYEDCINVSFTAGDFSQFAAFLNALERRRPVVFVDEFAITRAKKDDSGHRVNMDLAVFVKKQQDS